MTSAVEYNMMRKRNGLSLVRFDVRKLSDQDILDLRHAYEGMYAISDARIGDKRGYQAVARGHGYDQDLCHNPNAPFLPWHRSYMYYFEKNLTDGLRYKRGDQNLVITMPWWDWTLFDSTTDAPNGLPKAFDDDTYTDPTEANAVKPNPLRRAKSLYRIENLGASGDGQYTNRYPTNFRANIETLKGLAKRIPGTTQFDNLAGRQGAIEQPHNLVHGVIGGTGDPILPRGGGDMGSTVSAAFDPIFWLHHAFVDKLWFDWQKDHGNSTVPMAIRQQPLYNGMLGELTLDSVGKLKIEYGSQPVGVAASAITVNSGTDEAPLPPTMTTKIGALQHGGGTIKSAQLHFQGMRPPVQSYDVRVFVNAGPCDAATQTAGNPSYSGSLYIFGHGVCHGAKGHCNPDLARRDAYDLRAEHHFAPLNYTVDVTESINFLTRGLDPGASLDLVFSFVVVDVSGAQVSPEEIDVDSLSLTLE